MPSIRITAVQRRALEEARGLLQEREGRRLSLGETVSLLADLWLRNAMPVVKKPPTGDGTWRGDPLFDPDIGWHMGPTDATTIDRLLYGRK